MISKVDLWYHMHIYIHACTHTRARKPTHAYIVWGEEEGESGRGKGDQKQCIMYRFLRTASGAKINGLDIEHKS